MAVSLTLEELRETVREVMREELKQAGLRVDTDEHVGEAFEDFRFIRRLRKALDGAASKIGMAIILALLSGVLALLGYGFKGFVQH